MTTARIPDTNGWIEIKGNPISKVGVFQYLGKSLDLPGVELDKIYNVYRSAEELSDPETIESFKLVPWIEDHQWLGPNEGKPVEDQTIHGVTGEDVYFDAPYLKSNLKLFSEELAKKIENEKKELSLGYQCLHIFEEGMYNGEPYQIVQRKIRGNHLASVDEGRTGHDVRVLDKRDNLSEEPLMDEEKKVGSSDLMTKLVGLLEKVCEHFTSKDKEETADNKDAELQKEEMKRDEDAEEEAAVRKEPQKEEPSVKEEAKKVGDEEYEKMETKTMDAAEVVKSIFSQLSRKESLIKKASKHIGTFDASDMTFDETASYVVKKLGLACPKGHEGSILTGYFMAANKSAAQERAQIMDQAETVKSSQIEKFINGEG